MISGARTGHDPVSCLRTISCLGLVLGVLGAQAAFAAPPPDSETQKPVTLGSGPALTELAQALSQLTVSEPHLVAVGPLLAKTGPPLLPSARAKFQNQLLELVVPSLSLAKKRVAKPLTQTEAGVLARKEDLTLVYLSPELRGGNLRLSARVLSWPRSFWQRARTPGGTITAERLWQVPADSTIRSLLPTKRKTALVKKWKSPAKSPLALACGTGTDEEQALLAVTRRSVVKATLAPNGPEQISEAPWDSLSEISGAPLRAPLASARFEEGGILVSLSDRSKMVLVDRDLKAKQTFRRSFLAGAGTCFPFSTSGLGAGKVPCQVPVPAASEETPLAQTSGFSALAESRLTARDGTATVVQAQLPSDGGPLKIDLTLATGAPLHFEMPDVGGALLLSDLDGDGQLELVTSTAGAEGTDAVVISTLTRNGPVTVLRTKAPRVDALAVCPFTGTNPVTLVAAVGEELWIFE